MPLYDYRCIQCGKVTEVRHGFDDTHAVPCSECGGALKRVFNPAPIVFKGSGFYVTDSRPASSSGDSSPAPAAPPAATPPATPPASSSASDSAA
ncbi:MAG: FmdB family zinc ribbon protein [Candidatus Baltobacteraceae bacterium]